MNPIEEEIELPDPAVQPLVHPLDVPAARRTFAASWWLERLASPAIFFAVASALWATSNNFITPIVAPLIIMVCAYFASHYQSGEAWAYIPRKRHDHQRRVPTAWSAAHDITRTMLLCIGLILLLGWMIAQDFPPEVRSYAIGMGIGIVLIMAGNLVWNLMHPRPWRDASAPRSAQYVSLIITMGTLLYASIALPLSADLRLMETIIGVAIMLAIHQLWVVLSSFIRTR